MTSNTQSSSKSRVRPGIKRVALIVAGAAAIAAGVRVYLRHLHPPIEPPAITVADADPAIRDLVDAARDDVLNDPNSAEKWGHLGMVFAANRLDEEAIKSFEQTEKLDSNDGRWPYLRGVILAGERPDLAEAPLRRGVALLVGQHPTVRLQFAAVLLVLGKLDEAETEYRQLLAVDSNDPDAHFGLAKICITRGRWREAVQELSLAGTTPRLHAACSVLLAGAKSHLDGKADEHAVDADTVAAMSRKNPTPDPILPSLRPLRVGLHVRLEHAERVLDAGQTADALSELRELTRDYPRSEEAWRIQAEALYALGSTAEAEASTRCAIQLNPQSAESWKQLGTELLMRHQADEAVDAFRHATTIRTNDADGHEQLGSALAAAGQVQPAIDEFRTTLQLRPDRCSAYVKLAQALVATNRKDEAAAALRQATRIDPADAAARSELQRLQRASGGK